MNRTRLLSLLSVAILCTAAVLTTSPSADAQVISLAPGSPTAPPPPPPGPCPGAFSPEGDLYEPVSGATVPMGPAGCGLGWPYGPAPANVDAFSSGSGAPPFLPHPIGLISLAFTVDQMATGDAFGTCVTHAPGPYPPDVGSEACGLDFGLAPALKSTDASGDLFLTGPNIGLLGGSLPLPGSMPNFQVADGDGLPPAFGCQFAPPFGTLGLLEPGNSPGNDPVDDADALDVAPIAAWDFGLDGVPDVPVYYSVDGPTAAMSAGAVYSDDVLVAFPGGVLGLYAPAAALGLPGGGVDDIDGLVVMDAFFDGIYAPAFDIVLYSLAPGSATIGTVDGCTGIPIGEGDILVEGTPLGSPGAPCIYLHAADINLWDDFTCGVNPVTGATAGDNIDGFDLLPGSSPPTPICGPTPLPDASCHLADVTGAGKSLIKLKRRLSSPDKADNLSWKWVKGDPVVTAEFFSPDTSTNEYRLCIYDGSGLPQPRLQKSIIPGGITPVCTGKPCWKALGTKGFKYVSKSERRSSGISNAQMKEGAAGKSKVQIKTKGKFSNPPDPASLVPDVVVQLLATDGFTTECFKSAFPGSSGFGVIKKQDAENFLAKGP